MTMIRTTGAMDRKRFEGSGRSLGVAAVAALLAIGASARGARAQDWWFGFTYGAAVPTSDTKSFTDQSASWRNFGVEGRRALDDHFALGFSVGWNVFDDKTTETASFDGIDVTGTQFRYVNSFPLLLTAHYYIGRRIAAYRSGVRAFVGAGVGAYVIENRVDIGLFSLSKTNWHPGVAPEAGLVWKASGPWALSLSGRYNYAAESNDVKHAYWTFSAGIAWSN